MRRYRKKVIRDQRIRQTLHGGPFDREEVYLHNDGSTAKFRLGEYYGFYLNRHWHQLS